MRDFLQSISPLNRADRIRKPLLVIHGANDPRVPLAEAESIIAAARKNGTKVWSIIARDEGHGFAKEANANYRFMAAIAFGRSCLGAPP
jgi:dipeptidyl aminopeptidase/acylaminoacyl peptidase